MVLPVFTKHFHGGGGYFLRINGRLGLQLGLEVEVEIVNIVDMIPQSAHTLKSNPLYISVLPYSRFLGIEFLRFWLYGVFFPG